MSASWRPTRVDHIGVAVRDIAAASRLYAGLGLTIEPPLTLPHDGVRAAFVALGTVRIELLEPLGADGPIARFLTRRGEGLHHIAVAVRDIAEALDHARRQGLRAIDAAPRPGAHGTRVAFLHPKDTHGVLIELVESPAP